MTNVARSARAQRRAGAMRRICAIALVGVLAATTGCTMLNEEEAQATRVLQSVRVELDPSGKIQAVNGTAVFVDDSTGAASSTTTEYSVADAVDTLPVRVTTRYRTADGAGTDLGEIAGYSGRVDIELTLENLLVAAENVTFDVVGESRTTPALVGTPLSIAASTVIPEISPGHIVFDAESERRTNGVVSASGDTGSVIQWGALLAPPQSAATATFRLVADVKDFEVPSFDIAVQAGIHADLSFTGAMASAFDSRPDSELAAQQQTISLVADVNDVLTRAGGTITEVRKNLNDTSGRLGVRASQGLTTSSKQLTAEMSALSGQVTSLESALSSSLTGTASAMSAEPRASCTPWRPCSETRRPTRQR